MTTELDKLDRNILRLLEQDARQSKSRIAEQLKTNKAIVTYRINRLIKSHVVTGYRYYVNEAKLGATSYGLLLRFEGLLLQEQEDLVRHIRTAKIFDWITLTNGSWEAIAVSVVPNPASFTSLLDTFFEQFGAYVKSYIFYMDYQGSVADHNYLYSEPHAENVSYTHSTKKIELTNLQRDIVNLLTKRPTLSLLDMAKRLEKTYDTVQSHYRSLLATGVLLKCVPIINHELLGYTNTLCFYTLSPKPARINAFWETCRAHPNIVRQSRCLGTFTIVLNIHSQTEHEFKAITSTLNKEFSDCIAEYTALHTID